MSAAALLGPNLVLLYRSAAGAVSAAPREVRRAGRQPRPPDAGVAVVARRNYGRDGLRRRGGGGGQGRDRVQVRTGESARHTGKFCFFSCVRLCNKVGDVTRIYRVVQKNVG